MLPKKSKKKKTSRGYFNKKRNFKSRPQHTSQRNIREEIQKTFEGVLRITRSHTGYVTHPDKDADIEIPPVSLGTALHGDLVRVSVHSVTPDGHFTGEVLNILSRRKEIHVCKIKKTEGVYFCTPQDDRMYKNIVIPHSTIGNAKPGHKVAVRIIKWTKPSEDPIGEIVKILGQTGNHETEMQAILYDKNLLSTFPSEIDREAKLARRYLKEPNIQKRKDCRGIPTLTIDPKTAQDFDDALSVRQLSKDRYEIGVHIADVTHFVKRGTLLDKEAAKRATSIYLVDRTIPMLPETLSNDLCSLNPDEDKLTFSAVFILSTDGEVISEWFGKTRIRSNKRFTYEEAQRVLDAKHGHYYKELFILNRIAKKLAEKKVKEGAIAFSNNEVEITLDKKMFPVSIQQKERLDTHHLVEDFMLLANRRVAEFVSKAQNKKERHFVYRVHDKPDEERILALVALLRTLGYKIRLPKKISSRDINIILNSVKNKPEEGLINTATIQAMTKAVYATKNIGHFGLSFQYYTHFTSPIRRYPDMMVHRILDRYLRDEKIPQNEIEYHEGMAIYSSQMEKIAEEAERESIKYKQSEYMEQHIGKTYSGIISGVARYGFFVKEETTNSEGLVSLRDIKDDYYEYNEKRFLLIGVRSKKQFQLGDRVKVRVKSVDTQKKQINYVLA